MIDEVPWGDGTLGITAVGIVHLVSHRAAKWFQQLHTQSPTDLDRGLSYSTIRLFYKLNIVASWIYLHNHRYFQRYMRELFQHFNALCVAHGGSGSISNHLGAQVRLAGMSGMLTCVIEPVIQFADVSMHYLLQPHTLKFTTQFSVSFSLFYHTIHCPHISNWYKNPFSAVQLWLTLQLCIQNEKSKMLIGLEPHWNIPDTLGILTSISMYFVILPSPYTAKQSALKLLNSIRHCFWKQLELWWCIQDDTG
jgi:hypothetical protein